MLVDNYALSVLSSRAMESKLYSIRMRASRVGEHISGAERLAPKDALEEIAASLLRRALSHPKGESDAINLTVEAVDPSAIRKGRLPDLTTVAVDDWRQGRRASLATLVDAGVDEGAARKAMDILADGPSPSGGAMRGAMLIGARSGRRYEPDPCRGVRANRMDLTEEAEGKLRAVLSPLGLDNPHVREALVLAAKVISAPQVIAELCWSDDPDYTAGYVASKGTGYVRFPHLKPFGETRGGRAFFVQEEGLDTVALIDYLEQSAFLVDEIGALEGYRIWKD